jgi:hypothetical protein
VPLQAPDVFCVTETQAAAIRSAFDQQGELSAAIELRRLFPGVTDNAEARAFARTIAGWKPLAVAVPLLGAAASPPRPLGRKGRALSCEKK